MKILGHGLLSIAVLTGACSDSVMDKIAELEAKKKSKSSSESSSSNDSSSSDDSTQSGRSDRGRDGNLESGDDNGGDRNRSSSDDNLESADDNGGDRNRSSSDDGSSSSSSSSSNSSSSSSGSNSSGSLSDSSSDDGTSGRRGGDDSRTFGVSSQALFRLELKFKDGVRSGGVSNLAKVEFQNAQGLDIAGELVSFTVLDTAGGTETALTQNLSIYRDDGFSEWEVDGVRFPAPAQANRYIIEIVGKVGEKSEKVRIPLASPVL